MLEQLKLLRRILLSNDMQVSKRELIGLTLKYGLKDVEELETTRKILFSSTDGIPVSKERLIDLSLEFGIKNLYVGNRIHNFSDGLVVRDMRGRRLTPEESAGSKSIFKHSDGEFYYYDVLDHNRRCERISDGALFIRHACGNLERVEDVIKEGKIKVKGMGK